ncbi:MAG: AraC family transcriptional regulator [Hyphomonadaceae bacterium]|nr:AraC family transcriptional regulator [Hyphomonadaceae bacterium]MBP9235417.1 AraC family transcriptional regulator [Hyphomonadaceae bacterium]
MAELTVGAGLARGLMKFAIARGADPAALSARSAIASADVEDQDHRVPISSYVALMRAAKELSGDAAIALHYGEEVDLSEVSIAGLIMNASADMREAFVQMNRFGRLAVEVETEAGESRFKHVLENGELWLVDTRANPNAFHELTEVTFARQICGLRRFLPRPFALEVHVTHPAPAYAAEYSRVFACPVVFESRWNAMRTDATLQSHKVALQPHYVFGVLSEKAEALVRQLEKSKSARGRVEILLMPMLHTGDVGMDAIAAKMGVSRQTLFRRLRAEDVTYEKVLDDLRRRLALNYLSGRKASVNETAYLVGFSDPAAFSRAFKRWTGKSPSEMRS